MYFYSDSDFVMMMFFIVAAFVVLSFMRRAMSKSKETASTTTTTQAKPQTTAKTQMAEDMRATKTSRVVDAVSILDDLGTTSSGYRHYCELVGTSMASSGVIAPYSKRPVAYYDIKCYRIDATRNGQEETLIAHEHSFDPFFFTDGSCDTPIYIDLESFDDNVILVNSTNHIEGPNSDFAKAVGQSGTSTATGTAGMSGAYAMVGGIASRAGHFIGGVTRALRDALSPRTTLQPACALVGGSLTPGDAPTLSRHIKLSDSDGRRGRGDRDDHDDHDGPRGGRGGRAPQRRPQFTIQMGYGGMPPHLGQFMGPSHQPYVMGGGYTTRPTSTNAADVILGMSLATLLNTMSTASQQAATGGTDTFRGYRLVENVVPLGSPIYCIGEIYRHGTDVYMSRSLAEDYPTSFFATKPESEVLSAIGAI